MDKNIILGPYTDTKEFEHDMAIVNAIEACRAKITEAARVRRKNQPKIQSTGLFTEIFFCCAGRGLGAIQILIEYNYELNFKLEADFQVPDFPDQNIIIPCEMYEYRTAKKDVAPLAFAKTLNHAEYFPQQKEVIELLIQNGAQN